MSVGCSVQKLQDFSHITRMLIRLSLAFVDVKELKTQISSTLNVNSELADQHHCFAPHKNINNNLILTQPHVNMLKSGLCCCKTILDTDQLHYKC